MIRCSIPTEDATTTMNYEIVENGKYLKTTSIVKQTAGVDIITETFTDSNGRTTSVNNIGDEGPLTTTYEYDAIGQLKMVIDTKGNQIISVYDQLGRRIEMTHPDAGTNHYWYDPVGNLVKMQTPNLLNYPVSEDKKFIKYNYDALNRLVKITFPPVNNGGNMNDVYYGYGSSNHSDPNGKGKLVKQADATGDYLFEYGNMGELIKSTRQIAAPNLPTRKFIHEYEYDSHNRLLNMTYPDNEIVSYFYDLGGNLTQMKSQYNGQNYTFIKQIVYDEFEQRTAIKYGNNTVNTYTYDEKLRRLETMTATQSNNILMFDNRYDFDLIGNITRLRNLAQPSGYNMGGEYTFIYEYDNFNRLKGASGDFTGYTGTPAPTFGDLSAGFTLEMEYDELHNITKKAQTHVKNNQVFEPNNYVNNYVYSTTKPHQVETIFNEDNQETEYFNYDANGNLYRYHNDQGDTKGYFWDEQNRLRSMVIDGGRMMHYIYDAAGERTLKAESEIQELYENGEPTDGGSTMDTYTTYPSPFLTIDEKSFYTKHYYAGDQRIASRPAGKAAFGALSDSPEIIELRMKQRRDAQIVADTVELGTLRFEEKPDFGEELLLEVYYFHPDHLGSSTMISDGAGYAYQMFLNLPFGETLAEQRRPFRLNNPYKFNGKELDPETGLYYYGARYYDSRTSVFLSVDPLADQTMTPYQYTYQNPVRYIDPTGMAPEENLVDDPIYGKNFWGNLKYLGDDGKNNGRVYFVSGQTKRDVKNATANGEFYTGNLDSSSEVSSVPSQMIFAVDNSLRATLSSDRENGGHNTFSSFKTTQWDEGPEIRQQQVAEGIMTKGSIVPFVVDGNRINIDLSDLDVYYHLHPDKKGLGSSSPSNYTITIDGKRQRRGDIPYQAGLESKGYNGNPFVVGAGDKRVNFYDGNGSVMKVKYEQFRNVLLSEFFKHIRF